MVNIVYGHHCTGFKIQCSGFYSPKGCEGEANSGNIHYKGTQEMFCGNNDKIKTFKECCGKYYMIDVLIIPTLVDSSATHP